MVIFSLNFLASDRRIVSCSFLVVAPCDCLGMFACTVFFRAYPCENTVYPCLGMCEAAHWFLGGLRRKNVINRWDVIGVEPRFSVFFVFVQNPQPNYVKEVCLVCVWRKFEQLIFILA